MSRPIDRLPPRRQTNEPREPMNCKSCRKRKIKCNRLRPTCEACQVFACPCIYDAVPKKRGPKTDVLEALLKRVDGLEKQLHHEKQPPLSPNSDSASRNPSNNTADILSPDSENGPPPPAPPLSAPPRLDKTANIPQNFDLMSPIPQSAHPFPVVSELLLNLYFERVHGKPYYIFDEALTRHRMQINQLPIHLSYAICAVSARYSTHLGGYNGAVRAGQEYARRARMELDIDEPTTESLQTLLLLTLANYQSGKGKKAYMYLTSGISMAFALDLHRELSPALKVNPAEREARRRLFWACYLMDRFSVCGSKRPSLIADEPISLRLPSWQMHPGAMVLEGDYFPNGSTVQYMASLGKPGQSGTGMLIGISRILGVTNRYLAAGGVKGDSHFPWHSLSNLSKIRQDLDLWASDTQDVFSSVEHMFSQPDCTLLILSKLIYHLIHCLIYRPFLPVDLAELSGTSQHQSWQIEATNLCFFHANAIAELVEIGRASGIRDWPAFVGYCVCTAGTIHVHGVHYPGREGDAEVFSASADALSREMHQLSELRFLWAGLQHQLDTLRTVYGCHNDLVKSLASNPMRFSPVFQLEDFFDRYPGQAFDGSHLTFTDVMVDAVHESLPAYNIDQRANIMYMGGNLNQIPNLAKPGIPPPRAPIPSQPVGQESRKKRRTTSSSASEANPQFNPVPTSAPVGSTVPPKTQADQAAGQNLVPQPEYFANLQPFTPSSLATFSPSFTFSALPNEMKPEEHQPSNSSFDPMLGPTSYEQQPTPGAASASGSAVSDPEKDPFLSLLEQLAENDVNRGGPSELDFFLGRTR